MPFERVLVSMKGYIGDAVMAQPALAALGTEFDLTIAAAGIVSELLSPEIAACYLVPSPSRSIRSTLEEARRLRSLRFKTAILINNSFRSAAIARLAGIPKRIGFATENRDFLLTDAILFDRAEFQAKSVARLLEPLGIAVQDPKPRFRSNETSDRSGIAFQPGARDPWKRLSTPTAVQFAKNLANRGHLVVLVGGAEERPFAEPVLEALGSQAIDLVGKLEIGETLGTLQGMDAAVGPDTGVMHLAVAAGCPTVQIFASDRAAKWGHNYPPHRVLVEPSGSMAILDPDRVMEAALEIARSATPASSSASSRRDR